MGESILQAATGFRGDAVQLILLVEGRRINVLICLPRRGEESVPPMPPGCPNLGDWADYAENRLVQCADAWNHGDDAEE